MFNKLFILFIIALSTNFAQISGISGGKLSVPYTASLEVGVAEFESSFSTFLSYKGAFADMKIKKLINNVFGS